MIKTFYNYNPSLLRKCVEVLLTPEQVREAEAVAARRTALQRGADRKDRVVHEGQGPERDREGAIGERVVSLALGVKWENRSIPIAKWDNVKHEIRDVGTVEVKATSVRNGSLMLKTWDKALKPPYILVHIGDFPRCHVIGWMYGWEVKRESNWDAHQKVPCFRVYQDDTHPIETLYDLLGIPMPSEDTSAQDDEFVRSMMNGDML